MKCHTEMAEFKERVRLGSTHLLSFPNYVIVLFDAFGSNMLTLRDGFIISQSECELQFAPFVLVVEKFVLRSRFLDYIETRRRPRHGYKYGCILNSF